MMRLDALRKADAGMTIVEVMISAVIFFIVLTAILGLTMLSTNMGMQAKQNSVLTNVVNSYIERVQSMPFDMVVVGTDSGQLAASETITVGEYTVVITPTVSPGDVTGLKELHIQVTLTRTNGGTQSTSTTVTIRDKTRFLTQGVRSAATDPQVEWTTAVMPAANEVVWAGLREGGGVLRIAATASASEGRTIETVIVRADSGWPLRSTSGELAMYEPGTQEWTMPYFVWNTLQEEIVDIETGATDFPIRDGIRTITISVSDSEGVETSIIWTLLVDNHNPDPPLAPTAANTGLGQSTISWTTAMDGTTPTDSYGLKVLRQSTGGTWSEVLSEGQPGASTAKVMAVAPFSRYYARLQSVSPLGNLSSVTDMASSWISPPHAHGTATVTAKNGGKYDTAVSLYVDPPQFVASGVSYKWVRSTSPSGPWSAPFATTAAATETYTNAKPAVAYYYRCLVTFTPGNDFTGESRVTVVDFPSTIVGPTGTSSGVLPESW